MGSSVQKTGESEIVGEWNNFVFKMIEKEDIEQVLANFRQVFCKDAPLLSLIKCTESPESLQDVSDMVTFVLQRNESDRLSFCALDKDGQIVGLRLTHIVRPEPKWTFVRRCNKVEQIVRNFSELEAHFNLFNFYGVSEYAELAFASVNPDVRGQGLAEEMYRRSMALFRARGIAVCKSVFTSPFAQRIAVKCGFEEHARRDFVDFTDENGGQAFVDAKPGQTAVVMALKMTNYE